MTAGVEPGRPAGARGGRTVALSVVAAAIAFAISLACDAAGGLLYVAIWAEEQPPLDVTAVMIPPLGSLAFGSVGAALMIRRPDLAAGWLMLGVGLLAATSWASTQYLAWGAATDTDLALGSVAAWISGLFIVAVAILIPRLLLELPDGRLATPRWRVADVLMGAILVFVVAIQLLPGPLIDWETYDNPFGIEALRGLKEPLAAAKTPFFLSVIAVLLIGCASLMARFRRARDVAREQLKWIAWSVLMIAVSFVALPVLQTAFPSLSALWGLLVYLAVLSLPLAIGIAVLRYRLYAIDRLISRTISWAIVSGTLAATFVVVELALQAILVNVNGGSTVAVAASTLAVAAAFSPVRRRVRSAIDRRFDRRRADAELVLATFRDRLRSELDLDVLRANTLETAQRAIQPSISGFWLRGEQPPSDERSTVVRRTRARPDDLAPGLAAARVSNG
jgi:hypothetical protein